MAENKSIDVVEELNALIQLDFDASKTYEAALEHIDEPDVRDDLDSFRRDHLRHIDDLTMVVRQIGGEPKEPNRDFKGVLLEGMTKVRSVTGTIGALKAMRMNEKLTNKSYQQAVALPLPDEAMDVAEANLSDERRHLAAIEMHLERLGEDVEESDADKGPPDIHAPI